MAEVAATGGKVVLNLDVMLACPVSLFPRLAEGVIVEGAVIEGKEDDESGGFIPAERLPELRMEEVKVDPAVFEVGVREEDNAWLYVLAPLVCVPLYDCVKLLDGAVVAEMELEPDIDRLCDGWPT